MSTACYIPETGADDWLPKCKCVMEIEDKHKMRANYRLCYRLIN